MQLVSYLRQGGCQIFVRENRINDFMQCIILAFGIFRKIDREISPLAIFTPSTLVHSVFVVIRRIAQHVKVRETFCDRLPFNAKFEHIVEYLVPKTALYE